MNQPAKRRMNEPVWTGCEAEGVSCEKCVIPPPSTRWNKFSLTFDVLQQIETIEIHCILLFSNFVYKLVVVVFLLILPWLLSIDPFFQGS